MHACRIVLATTTAIVMTPIAGCTVTTDEGSPSATKPPQVTITIPGVSPTGSATATPGTTVATIPDVVGKDHQLAQDTLQAAGFYQLLEEDATGQKRSLILDRNWVVVEQRPRAGSRVPVDTTVLLRSKKKTDP